MSPFVKPPSAWCFCREKIDPLFFGGKWKMNHWSVKQILQLVPSKNLDICFCYISFICPKKAKIWYQRGTGTNTLHYIKIFCNGIGGWDQAKYQIIYWDFVRWDLFLLPCQPGRTCVLLFIVSVVLSCIDHKLLFRNSLMEILDFAIKTPLKHTNKLNLIIVAQIWK